MHWLLLHLDPTHLHRNHCSWIAFTISSSLVEAFQPGSPGPGEAAPPAPLDECCCPLRLVGTSRLAMLRLDQLGEATAPSDIFWTSVCVCVCVSTPFKGVVAWKELFEPPSLLRNRSEMGRIHFCPMRKVYVYWVHATDKESVLFIRWYTLAPSNPPTPACNCGQGLCTEHAPAPPPRRQPLARRWRRGQRSWR
jgi:hypothetical protein